MIINYVAGEGLVIHIENTTYFEAINNDFWLTIEGIYELLSMERLNNTDSSVHRSKR